MIIGYVKLTNTKLFLTVLWIDSFGDGKIGAPAFQSLFICFNTYKATPIKMGVELAKAYGVL